VVIDGHHIGCSEEEASREIELVMSSTFCVRESNKSESDAVE
jgi:hypothetical protein